MIRLLLFLGIILSIVKANGWFVVPMPVLVFCWVGASFAGCFIPMPLVWVKELQKR